MLVLVGVTNDPIDLSVDTLRAVTLPLLQNFGLYGVTLAVRRRGVPPKGGGEVLLSCPVVRSLVPIHVTEEGLVRRVRGTVFCAKISPTLVPRVVHACREVLNGFLPDVRIDTDHCKGKEAGDSPGYSLQLVAETTTGALLAVERTARTRSQIEQDLQSNLDQGVNAEGKEQIVTIAKEKCYCLPLLSLLPLSPLLRLTFKNKNDLIRFF